MKGLSYATDDDLLKELRNRDYALSAWCSADVLHRAKETDKECTEEDAKHICNEMDRKHDANLGITWDTIDYWLDELEK